MSFESAFKQRMIFEAAQDPQITRMAEVANPYTMDDDPDTDVTAPFAALASPLLAKYGLSERSDIDQVLVNILANDIKEQSRG